MTWLAWIAKATSSARPQSRARMINIRVLTATNGTARR